ncbi:MULTISPECIES: hypothetical protein [Sorangium]|uniref:hypothetical protein n=1 Tax=Sorangium TaxID=39643 RepID=UPI003D9C2BCD
MPAPTAVLAFAHVRTSLGRRSSSLKKRRLFRFLRLHGGELFDDALQGESETMNRDTGAGKDPVPQALMKMAVLLPS